MDAKTLNNTAQASNQGLFTVTRRDYARYRGLTGLARAAVYLTSFLPVSLKKSHYQFLRGGFDWLRFRERFIYGDTNPVMVLDAKTGLAACYTDLRVNPRPSFHVIKIFREKLHLVSGGASNGDTYAAISVYQMPPRGQSTNRWLDFYPIVVNCVSTDEVACDFVKEKIPESHWKALALGLEQVGQRREPGLYDIQLPAAIEAKL